MKHHFILCCLLAGVINGKNLNADCTTTFIVSDCTGQPVSGVSVSITKCSDNKVFGSTTDASGSASFGVCKNDICKTKVTVVGSTERSSNGVAGDCSGDKNATCKLSICDNGN